MDRTQMLRIVEQYSQKRGTEYEGIKVTRIADQKTVFVEQFGESGRSILMNEYKIDGTTYWAGYSSRSQTMYISVAA